MAKEDFDSIEEAPTADVHSISMLSATAESMDTNAKRKKEKIFMLAALVALCVVTTVIYFVSGVHTTRNSWTGASADAVGKSDHTETMKYAARACNFHECNTASCDVDAAPYTCITNNGGPHGGCSSYPWTAETCEDQCDLSPCANMSIPPLEYSCENVKCPDEWCASPRLCPNDAQYQCLGGAAMYGCSDDKFLWAF